MFLERFTEKQESIHRWLESMEKNLVLPLYSSVDIRDAGFKTAVVDTNLFPAGFNNLCEHGLEDSVKFLREAILRRLPSCKNILLVAEEHTRNTWYLEHIRILQQIIEQAGFYTKIATFLTIQPDFCQTTKYVELETATGASVKIHCFKRILSELEQGRENFDLIIMNNDLTTGIPDILRKSTIPIYPSIQAGWHSRLKSHHFFHTQELMAEFGEIISMDPWFFSCLFTVVDKVDINSEVDRLKLADAARGVFRQIETKYKEHGIKEKPYIIMKSDSGTYGMGVMPFESPEEIINVNRKDKNKLHIGKGSQVIERYLIQEGVPTIYNSEHGVCEVCIYQIENNLVGGFYRTHPTKSSRENLNAQGVTFSKMCPHLKKYGDCGIHHDMNIFDVYRILARIAAIAARREITQLEAQAK
jgi:glutamate--cysteine ligase